MYQLVWLAAAVACHRLGGRSRRVPPAEGRRASAWGTASTRSHRVVRRRCRPATTNSRPALAALATMRCRSGRCSARQIDPGERVSGLDRPRAPAGRCRTSGGPRRWRRSPMGTDSASVGSRRRILERSMSVTSRERGREAADGGIVGEYVPQICKASARPRRAGADPHLRHVWVPGCAGVLDQRSKAGHLGCASVTTSSGQEPGIDRDPRQVEGAPR